MAVVVIDASVVIAHLEPGDALHERAQRALDDHAGDDLVLPASAYAEALVRPVAAGRLADARAAIDALELRVAPIERSIAERAAALSAGAIDVRLPDALVIATADALDAARLLTGDARWARISDRVSVI